MLEYGMNKNKFNVAPLATLQFYCVFFKKGICPLVLKINSLKMLARIDPRGRIIVNQYV